MYLAVKGGRSRRGYLLIPAYFLYSVAFAQTTVSRMPNGLRVHERRVAGMRKINGMAAALTIVP